MKKKVYQYTPEGKYIRSYESAVAAAKLVGIKVASIRNACRGRSVLANKFIWLYEPEKVKWAEYHSQTHSAKGSMLSWASVRQKDIENSRVTRKAKASKDRRDRSRLYRGKILSMYKGLRSRSLKRNMGALNFDIDWFTTWLESKGYTKIWNDWKESDFDSKLAPSVDRLSNKTGYHRDNIQLVTWEINFLRGVVSNHDGLSNSYEEHLVAMKTDFSDAPKDQYGLPRFDVVLGLGFVERPEVLVVPEKPSWFGGSYLGRTKAARDAYIEKNFSFIWKNKNYIKLRAKMSEFKRKYF